MAAVVEFFTGALMEKVFRCKWWDYTAVSYTHLAVDLLVIGRYCGPESVAAVSTGTQVTQIITSLMTGLTLGLSLIHI